MSRAGKRAAFSSTVLWACVAWLCCWPLLANAADTLTWNTKSSVVSADIQSSSLLEVLEKIAAATHWQVFVEPDTTHIVSAKFKELPPGEALHLLLGEVNFALLPGTNGSPRLFVFRSSQRNATRRVEVADAARDHRKVIPNQLIVRLKHGVNIDDLARLLGAKVTGKIPGLDAYRLQFDDAAATEAARQQLASNPDVTSVENNYALNQPAVPQSLGAGLATPQLQLKPPPSNGRTIIGLIDTAVQPLGGNLDQFLLKQISVAGDAQLDPNTPSHGTAMAETMLRTLQLLGNGSSSAQILPVDVYGNNPTTSTFDVAQGVALAIDQGANPINLSLGSSADSQVLRDLIAQGTQQGITFYAAKGNTPDTTPEFPAADPGVTAVTAIDSNGQVAPWANRAPLSAVGAPGAVPINFNNQGFMVQGTSPATAIVSATAASLMENGMSASAASLQIRKSPTAVTIPNPGK